MSGGKMIHRDHDTTNVDEEGLDDLRRAIAQGKHDGISDADLLKELHSRVHAWEKAHLEFTAKVDNAFPGADMNRHREDHEEISQAKVESDKAWKDMKARVISGIVLAIVASLVFFGIHSIATLLGYRIL